MSSDVAVPAFDRGAAIEYLKQTFGGSFDFDQSDFTVGVALQNILPFNPERVMFTIMNLGATIISVSPDQLTTALHGLRLGPNGGVVSFNVRDDGVIPTLNWTAVSDVAGGALYVIETYRISKL